MNFHQNDHRACSILQAVSTLFIAAAFSFYFFQSQHVQIQDKWRFMFLHSNGNVVRDIFSVLSSVLRIKKSQDVRLIWNQTVDIQQHTDTLTDSILAHQYFTFTDTLLDLGITQFVFHRITFYASVIEYSCHCEFESKLQRVIYRKRWVYYDRIIKYSVIYQCYSGNITTFLYNNFILKHPNSGLKTSSYS